MTVKNVKVFFDAVAFVVAEPITVDPFIRISASIVALIIVKIMNSIVIALSI